MESTENMRERGPGKNQIEGLPSNQMEENEISDDDHRIIVGGVQDLHCGIAPDGFQEGNVPGGYIK